MASSFVEAITQESSAGTQRGPGTEAISMMIAGVRVNFPCKPYPSQMAMMSKVIQGLKTRKNCLLESPTGSGKSLALLCSALAWQRHEAIRVAQYNAEIDARQEAAMEAERMERKKKRKSEEKNQCEAELTSKLPKNMDSENNGNEKQDQTNSSFDVSTEGSRIPVFDLTDDDDDDFKPSKRSRFSTSSNLNQSNYTSDSSGDPDTLKESVAINKGTKPQETEDSPYFVPAEKKLTVPKIFFGTRTHKQIAQITRELRKTGYKNVRSVVLASREHTCINPTVEKLPNKNEACRDLLQNTYSGKGCIWHTGARKLASFGALSNAGLMPAYDVEDLVVVGRKHKACPYYVTRFLLPNADIIFCPYNYMIDPNIRKSMGLELEGHVLIFDEAHNMEDAARESSNISLKQDEIQRTMQDCEKVGRLGNEPYAHSEISKLLSTLSQWMDTQTSELRENTFNSSGKCWTGTDFLGSVQASGLDEEIIKMHLTYFVAINAQRENQIEAEKERGSRRVDEKPVITSQSIGTIENVFKLFEVLYKDNGRHRGDFRVAMSKDTVRGRRDGNTGPMRSYQVLSLHLWCLNPAVAFEFLKTSVHSIVLTSGTLSPMQSFESELDTPFPLKLEANHVIKKSQCWAAVVGTGPNGANLNGSYANASTLKYQDEIGNIVLRVCQVMPHGVLCFFPSYKMLENLATRWKTTGLLDKIEQVKTVVLEPRSGPVMFQEAMDNFYQAIEDSTFQETSMTGALFLAVCRGKVSEGLDFADNNARAVICVGIPFPNVRDMQVELKREYNSKNTSRGLLAGGEWYEIQAFRALNQALGRCIRHRNDWGAILLVDDRYIRTPRYVTSLSKWIRSSVQNFNNWSSLESSMQGFRDGMLSVKYGPLAFDGDNSMNSDGKFNLSRGGAAEDLSLPVFGMNNEVECHGKPSFCATKENSTSAIMPFANSFSSGGDLDNVFHSNDDQRAFGSIPLNDTCPTTPDTSDIEKSPISEFKLPATPLSTFSKKRNQHNNKPEKSNTIASMFAKAVQKVKENSDAGITEFNPSQVAIGNFSSPSRSSENTTGTKRPREKKIRL